MSRTLYPDVGKSLLPVPMTEEEAQTLEVPIIHVSHLEPPETVLRDLTGVRVTLNCACFLLDQKVALFLLNTRRCIIVTPQPLRLSLRPQMLLRLEN